MSLRLFLRLLQPARAALFVGLYTGFTLLVSRVFFRLAWPREALFVTGAVTLPLLLGVALTSSLHATLHRPFALLLPGLLERLRRAAALAYVALTLTVTLLVCLAEPRAPAPAVFGLVLALLTLGCAHRHQGFPRLGPLGLLTGFFAVATAWLVFHLGFAHRLLPAMQAAPWAFLLAGATSAAATFSFGFARRTLRDRATTPYFSSAVTWGAVLDRSAFRRQLAELSRFNTSRGLGRQRTGRPWSLAAVGPRRRDWLRVLDHQRAVSPVRLHVILGITMTVVILFLTGSFGALGVIDRIHPFHWTDFFAILAGLTAPAATHREFVDMMVNSVIVISIYIPYVQSSVVARPVITYPIGRTRLAGVVFAHACRQLVASLLVPTAAFWTCSLLGQVALGRFSPGLGAPAIAVIDLSLLPILPLLGWTQFLGRPSTRKGAVNVSLPAFLVGLGAAMLVATTRHVGAAFVLSWSGAVAICLATTAALLLMHRSIRRHYRSCDLTAEGAFAMPFGAGR